MTSAAQYKETVLEAFDTLFNKRDFDKAATFWSPNYIQHSAHIEPGRDGLFNLVKALPHTLRYENHLILAEGDMVMLHGRFSGRGGRPWIAAVKNGKLASVYHVENWMTALQQISK